MHLIDYCDSGVKVTASYWLISQLEQSSTHLIGSYGNWDKGQCISLVRASSGIKFSSILVGQFLGDEISLTRAIHGPGITINSFLNNYAPVAC